jgi:hypothetical protein
MGPYLVVAPAEWPESRMARYTGTTETATSTTAATLTTGTGFGKTYEAIGFASTPAAA